MLKIRKKKAKDFESPKSSIGILSFEVANAMSRAVHLHRSLSDGEISTLHHQILSSPALRSLISPNETHLLALAAAEKLDELNRISAVASRMGRRCSIPALQGFEHVYADLLNGRIDPSNLGLLARDMETAARKMERLVSSTAALYGELEALRDLEMSGRKFCNVVVNDHARKVFDQRLQWQRQDVKQLRESSLWNESYDKVVLLLARAVCTIHCRICQVFGESVLELDVLRGGDESRQLSGPVGVFRHPPLNSGVVGGLGRIEKCGQMDGLRFNCGANPGRMFMECLSLRGQGSWRDGDECFEERSCVSQSRIGSLVAFGGEQGRVKGRILRPKFGPKGRLTMFASSSTVGGSALALHYANVIIVIEKLLSYPHLIGEEAKDDLYQMLPASLRAALRKSLKYYVKDLAIYDASLAHDWKEAIKQKLSWISPMAHKMIRWQAERNFEQQQIVLRGGVLLLQTLYFADREKTEAVICELLVGLNYICRYEQQQNALLDCASSFDFDDGNDWQVQY